MIGQFKVFIFLYNYGNWFGFKSRFNRIQNIRI